LAEMTDAGHVQVRLYGNEGMLFRQVFVARLTDVEVARPVTVPFFPIHSARFAAVVAQTHEFIELTQLETVRVKTGSFSAGRSAAFAAE
jgi:hypothetical protein